MAHPVGEYLPGDAAIPTERQCSIVRARSRRVPSKPKFPPDGGFLNTVCGGEQLFRMRAQ
jgi:hypothetical protein